MFDAAPQTLWPKWYRPENLTYLERACRIFGVSKAEFQSKRRSKEYSHRRFALAYVLHIKTDLSYPQIARVIGVKNHTSVIYAVDQAPDLIKRNRDFALSVKRLETVI